MTARKLNAREKRMLLIGLAALAATLVFTYGVRGIDQWSKSRTSLAAAKKKLGEVETDKAKLAGLMALVPVFEFPEPQEKQKTLFREKLYEQLKRSGINTEPPQPLLGKKITVGGATYQVLKIKCKGKCKFDQFLDFLANLKENPYIVGVEELQVRLDTKEPPEKRKDKDVDVDLIVSTFVRDVASKPGPPTRNLASGSPTVEVKSVEHADTNSR
ncbi:MAG: hypothetical protein NTZ17_12915 [Phycisphaerae bacterium]|nr:hypothetical protein [Phycisphaerae bacterium]